MYVAKSPDEKVFVIETVDGPIGSISLDILRRDHRATLAIMIGDRAYWGKGLGREAIETMLRYAFVRQKLQRVELSVYSYNERARALYRKLGFRLEGLKRKAVYYKGRYYDELIMGILKEDWLTKKSVRIQLLGIKKSHVRTH